MDLNILNKNNISKRQYSTYNNKYSLEEYFYLKLQIQGLSKFDPDDFKHFEVLIEYSDYKYLMFKSIKFNYIIITKLTTNRKTIVWFNSLLFKNSNFKFGQTVTLHDIDDYNNKLFYKSCELVEYASWLDIYSWYSYKNIEIFKKGRVVWYIWKLNRNKIFPYLEFLDQIAKSNFENLDAKYKNILLFFRMDIKENNGNYKLTNNAFVFDKDSLDQKNYKFKKNDLLDLKILQKKDIFGFKYPVERLFEIKLPHAIFFYPNFEKQNGKYNLDPCRFGLRTDLSDLQIEIEEENLSLKEFYLNPLGVKPEILSTFIYFNPKKNSNIWYFFHINHKQNKIDNWKKFENANFDLVMKAYFNFITITMEKKRSRFLKLGPALLKRWGFNEELTESDLETIKLILLKYGVCPQKLKPIDLPKLESTYNKPNKKSIVIHKTGYNNIDSQIFVHLNSFNNLEFFNFDPESFYSIGQKRPEIYTDFKIVFYTGLLNKYPNISILVKNFNNLTKSRFSNFNKLNFK